MATIIKSDGSLEMIDRKKGSRNITLEKLQSAVSGDIELVNIPGSREVVLIVNENGIMMNLPINKEASKLAQIPIVGDAVLCMRSGCHLV